jgi:Glycosyl transferase family 2
MRDISETMRTLVHQIDLATERTRLEGLQDYAAAMVLLRFSATPIGFIRVEFKNGVLEPEVVDEAIDKNYSVKRRLEELTITRWLLKNEPHQRSSFPSWSIVICTRDRADGLSRCLASILKAQFQGGEIIVVDNAPTDESAFRVAREYGVKYVREDRQGLNWARSCGASAAGGEVVIFTDDDVVVDSHWVEAILKPFDNPRVGAVTGLVLPFEIETRAQELFERYGGLKRGYDPRVFDYLVVRPTSAGAAGV